DHVEEGHATIFVAAGDFDDETEVGLDHFLAGYPVPALDALGQDDFFFGGQKPCLADFLEIETECSVAIVGQTLGRVWDSGRAIGSRERYRLGTGRPFSAICGGAILRVTGLGRFIEPALGPGQGDRGDGIGDETVSPKFYEADFYVMIFHEG